MQESSTTSGQNPSAPSPSPLPQAQPSPAPQGMTPPAFDPMQEHQKVSQQIQQLAQDPMLTEQDPNKLALMVSQMARQTLGDEKSWTEDVWAKSKYNHQGKGGTAVNFLTDFLRGMTGQAPMEQTIKSAAKTDYQNAIKDQSQALMLMRNQKSQQLQALKAQQMGLQQMIQDQQKQQASDQKEYLGNINFYKNQNFRKATPEELQAGMLPKGYVTQNIFNPMTKENESWIGPGSMKLSDMSGMDPALLKEYLPGVDPDKPVPSPVAISWQNMIAKGEEQKKALAAAEEKLQKEIEARKALEAQKEKSQENLLKIRIDNPSPSANTAAERLQQAQKEAILKQYEPARDSAERFNVMAENQEAGNKGDQQAMLSLLANHLGMTMGLSKGARINQAIINEAIKSRPWLQGMGSKFDKDGYLSGVTLTQPQMQQMVDLARSRFQQDVSKARSGAKYIGATDDGPTRTPGKSTMKYYLRKAGGDVNKAKALATADGWSQ